MKIGVCFGRFNPPHKGHKEAWKTAAKFDNYYIGTNPTTNGPSNPLPYDVKVTVMKAVCPEISDHIISEQNLFTLASKIYADKGDNVDLHVCTDENWLAESLTRCNGVAGKHGYYKFDNITKESTPRLSSATALRAAVKDGDRALFSDISGISADTEIQINNRVLKFFDIVGEYLE
jgi:hypothetical protein